ncbi:hypothetical protein IQ238_21755 [Pleurocapsales cyanobacterium LEGE 06147]|nr:hypothetical protein [Pleurocapsales cyanobacterium LEGE 06147]
MEESNEERSQKSLLEQDDDDFNCFSSEPLPKFQAFLFESGKEILVLGCLGALPRVPVGDAGDLTVVASRTHRFSRTSKLSAI